jgi:hypothetical protein
MHTTRMYAARANDGTPMSFAYFNTGFRLPVGLRG